MGYGRKVAWVKLPQSHGGAEVINILMQSLAGTGNPNSTDERLCTNLNPITQE